MQGCRRWRVGRSPILYFGVGWECIETNAPGQSTVVAQYHCLSDLIDQVGRIGPRILDASGDEQPLFTEEQNGAQGTILGGKAAHRSPLVAGAAVGSDSQKLTVAPRSILEMGRVWMKTLQLALQAGVRSSLFQDAGMRAPAAVHPGQRLKVACSRMGHSNGRCVLPGKAVVMAQTHGRPRGISMLMSLPIISGHDGLAGE